MTSHLSLGQHQNHSTESVGSDLDLLSSTLCVTFRGSRSYLIWWHLLKRFVHAWVILPRPAHGMTALCMTALCVCGATGVGAGEPDIKRPENQVNFSIETLPSRLSGISTTCDWGLNESCQLSVRIRNESDDRWEHVAADGGCTCLKVTMDDIPVGGIGRGESLSVRVVYSKPKEPGISPRSVRFAINDSVAVLPILVEWYAPVSLQKLEQTQRDTWRLTGHTKDGWAVKSIDSLSTDVTVDPVNLADRSFVIDLTSNVKVSTNCRLRCKAIASTQDKTIEQVLTVSLESNAPRSIPSRLPCRLEAGVLVGQTRLFFPRARIATRPNLCSSTLLLADGSVVPLSITQEPWGTSALKVCFASKSEIDRLNLNEDSEIRFLFDDETFVNCHILFTEE